MTKRFTETSLWNEDWFIALPMEYKLFWLFIKDACDHAGIWQPNITKFNKLNECTVDLKKALELLNTDKERITVLKNGRWFLIRFIGFQYGHSLNPKNRVHNSILNLLGENEVTLTSIRPQHDLTQGVKDKDKDKEKDKDKDKDKSLHTLPKKAPAVEPAVFTEAWKRYPKKIDKKDALKHYLASVKNSDDEIKLLKAVDNYNRHISIQKTELRYIKNGSTFFFNWTDWVDFKSTINNEIDEEE